MKILLGIFITLFASLSHSEEGFTLYTGSNKGTYFAIGQDIAKACKHLNISVEATDGSASNINSLLVSPLVKSGNRIGISQNDALSYLPAGPKQIKLKEVIPLYKEEITIVVNKKSQINSWEDLDGKRISVGVQGSGNWITAEKLKLLSGTKWQNVEKTPEDSILQVLTGDIDGMLWVAGTPTKMFAELPASMMEHIKIIPISNKAFDYDYTNVMVSNKFYSWQKVPIRSKAIGSTLIAASDVSDSAINSLTICIAKNMTNLRKFGHPKWKEIQLTKGRRNG